MHELCQALLHASGVGHSFGVFAKVLSATAAGVVFAPALLAPGARPGRLARPTAAVQRQGAQLAVDGLAPDRHRRGELRRTEKELLGRRKLSKTYGLGTTCRITKHRFLQVSTDFTTHFLKIHERERACTVHCD